MSSVHVYFASRILNLNNLSREDAEGVATNLSDGHPGVTNISMEEEGRRFIINRDSIDYVEVKL